MMKVFRKKRGFILLSLLGMLTLVFSSSVFAAEGVNIQTPYTHVSVPPGDSINYAINMSNDTDAIVHVPLTVNKPNEDWETTLRAGGWDIKEVSIKPNDTQTVTLNVSVPLQVEKGTYRFSIDAGQWGTLPIVIDVSEEGTFATDLTTDQPNIEGHADSTFSYQVKLHNRTAEKQNYALTSNASAGWDVTFTASAKQVSSIPVEAGSSETITVSIKPPVNVEKGTYQIEVQASTPATSSSVQLEAAIIGSYGISLTTPSGLLSSEVSAGDDRKIELLIRNTGSADLNDVTLTGGAPADWEVSFDPKTIETIQAGKSTTVTATVKASKNSISGDYVVSMNASNHEVSSDAQFRIAVKGSLLWGWLGVLIIAVVIGGLFYLFRVYGRR